MFRVSFVNTDILMVCIFEMYLVLIMEYVAYKNLECFFHFQNMHVEDVHADQFCMLLSKTSR
jgi:uncharacterized membrane protein